MRRMVATIIDADIALKAKHQALKEDTHLNKIVEKALGQYLVIAEYQESLEKGGIKNEA